MNVDVPLHIKNPPAIQRNVHVSGGTNWDLSRSAVQTPIRQLPDPEPVRVSDDASWSQVSHETLPSYQPADAIPKSAPSVFSFPLRQSTVSKVATRHLKDLSKSKTYLVVGHADSNERSPSKLSWARAKNVAAVLKRTGHSVTAVKAFGADRPASHSESSANRRVEIFAVAK